MPVIPIDEGMCSGMNWTSRTGEFWRFR